MAGLLAFLSYLAIEMTALDVLPFKPVESFGKERVRDIVHRRGSYRISATYSDSDERFCGSDSASCRVETRDRVNQGLDIHDHRKFGDT